MKQFTVTFQPMDRQVLVEKGTTLLEAERRAGLAPDAPCGGMGTCGKCMVEVISNGAGGAVGLQKSCRTLVEGDMTVKVPERKGHSILMDGSGREVRLNPAVNSVTIDIGKSVIGDSRSDWDRLKAAVAEKLGLNCESIPANIPLMKNLYNFLKDNNYTVNAVVFENQIIDLRKEDEPIYGMAFDVGTTSIVGYLMDLKTGEEKARASMLNPQAQFGADVIMRANYAMENGPEELSRAVSGGLTDLAGQAASSAGIEIEHIYLVTAVGNTCMHHLLLGISPNSLVQAPYNPTVSEPLIMDAEICGILVNPRAKLMLLPNIAGFVGADTSGVMLASEFDRLDKMTLAIDIGTNGELVMGSKARSAACSTAAGPAFEGAKIHCGMRGAPGAVDHVRFAADGNLEMSVIGGEDGIKPKGICGSGLLDSIACLLEAEIIEESGRLLSREEAEQLDNPLGKAIAGQLRQVDGNGAFFLASPDETGAKDGIFLTQKDIREVQLAKGAMAAGIHLLAKKLEVEISDIEQVLIAGAFGNYMDPKSACAIGLIPKVLQDRIKPVGNSAGEGSKIALVNRDEFYRASRMTRGVEFLELASDPEFQDTFVDCLEFSDEYDL